MLLSFVYLQLLLPACQTYAARVCRPSETGRASSNENVWPLWLLLWLWLHLRVAQDLYIWEKHIHTHTHIEWRPTLWHIKQIIIYLYFVEFDNNTSILNMYSNMARRGATKRNSNRHIIILLLIIVNGNLSIDYERNCWSIVCDGTMVGTVINLVRGPRQGVRWSVGNKFLIYVHLFGQSQSTKKMCSLYTEVPREVRIVSQFGFLFCDIFN